MLLTSAKNLTKLGLDLCLCRQRQNATQLAAGELVMTLPPLAIGYTASVVAGRLV